MKNAVVIVLILVATGVGFFAGMKYQQSKQPSRAGFQAMREMRQNASGIQRPQGANAVRGEIIDQDETSLTVKLPDESSKIVFLTENTQINKTTEGSTDDLKEGQQVMVFGQTNEDGSLSAVNIQLGDRLMRPAQSEEAN